MPIKKASLSSANMKTLMIEVNRIIEEVATEYSEAIVEGRVSEILAYPPNCGFSEEERNASFHLAEQSKSHISLLRKIFADASSASFLKLFNLIDGTSDPEIGAWKKEGVCLVDLDGKVESPDDMLHDQLFENYWEWKKSRKANWKLDNLPD